MAGMKLEDQIDKLMDDWHFNQGPGQGSLVDLLAALVREEIAAEREACAKVVEQTEADGDYTGFNGEESFWQSDAEATIKKAAAAIRARQETASTQLGMSNLRSK
jgi:hypothetical protein